MKFIITSTSGPYTHILPDYYIEILSENMIQVKTKDYDNILGKINYIEVESLEELMKVMKLTDDLIVSKTNIEGYDGEIEIYDDYRE